MNFSIVPRLKIKLKTLSGMLIWISLASDIVTGYLKGARQAGPRLKQIDIVLRSYIHIKIEDLFSALTNCCLQQILAAEKKCKEHTRDIHMV